jgi:mannose-6-phosphate isomerase-like protein (cupin superfamily)
MATTMEKKTAGAALRHEFERHVARWIDRKADWFAFPDTKLPGHERAQYRYIGQGASGVQDDPTMIPAGAFTLATMYLPPTKGVATHLHEAEEIFFVLEGQLTVRWEDKGNEVVETVLGKWDMLFTPPGRYLGFRNAGNEGCYFQVMIGARDPQRPRYKNEELRQESIRLDAGRR